MGLETTPVEPAAPKPSNLSGAPDLTIANHSFRELYTVLPKAVLNRAGLSSRFRPAEQPPLPSSSGVVPSGKSSMASVSASSFLLGW